METFEYSETDYEQLFVEYTEFLDEISSVMQDTIKNFHELLQNLEIPPTDIQYSDIVSSLEQETGCLKENINDLIKLTNQMKKNEVKSRKELKQFHEQYDKIYVDQISQQEYICKLECDLQIAHSELQQQSSFSMTLGSVLGNFVWKATTDKSVAQLLLSGDKMNEFFCILSGSLVPFVETYATDFPGQQTDEMQFIISMVGIVTNTVAYPNGSQFLIIDPNGRELLLQFLNVLPNIPSPSGDTLKHAILMALFNISINKNGLETIQQDGRIWTLLLQLIEQSTKQSQLKLIALKLLHSTTCNIMNPDIIPTILNLIPIEKIQQLETECDLQSFTILKDIKENVTNIQKQIIKHPFS